MNSETEFEEEYDGPQDVGADLWTDVSSASSTVEKYSKPVPVPKKDTPPKNKKTVHLKTVPIKFRGKKVHGTVTLVLWDKYAGRVEVTAEFPVEYRNGPAIVTLTNFIYPSSPEDVGINLYLHDFFAKVFGVDFRDVENMKRISSIADLEHRKMEIDAVLAVSVHGRSYFRIVSWEFTGDALENPGESAGPSGGVKPGELERLTVENRELRSKVSSLERKVAYWKKEADKYWDKVKELLARIPDSTDDTPPVPKNAPRRAVGKPVEAEMLAEKQQPAVYPWAPPWGTESVKDYV